MILWHTSRDSVWCSAICLGKWKKSFKQQVFGWTLVEFRSHFDGFPGNMSMSMKTPMFHPIENTGNGNKLHIAFQWLPVSFQCTLVWWAQVCGRLPTIHGHTPQTNRDSSCRVGQWMKKNVTLKIVTYCNYYTDISFGIGTIAWTQSDRAGVTS